MGGGLAAASSGLRGDVALTRRSHRAAWSRGTWRLPAAPKIQTRGRMRGARATESGAQLQSPGMLGPERLGGAGSGDWEGLQGGHLRDPLLSERPPGGPGPAPLTWVGIPPGPGTPASPPPQRAPSSAAFSPPKKLSRTSLLLRRSNQPPEPAPASRPASGMLTMALASGPIGCAFSLGRDHANRGWRAGQLLGGVAAEPRGRWIGEGCRRCVKFGCARTLSELIRAP